MRLMFAIALSVIATDRGWAQQYPSRPIEMIIPFTAGSGLDVNGRAIANALSEQLKQSVVVVNRDGASGTIGFGTLAAAKPDGYTIGFGPTTPISTAPHIAKGVKYDAESFSYICQVFETVFVLAVGPSSKFKSFQELLAEAKARPLTYGSAGIASVPHLSIENVGRTLGVQFQHIPYKGDGGVVPALLRGDIDFAIAAVATISPQPTFRTLATFSNERQKAFPDTPTIKELGVARSVPSGQVGLFAQNNLPPDVQQALEGACRTVTESAPVQRVIATTGQLPKYKKGAEFREDTIEDFKFKGELIKLLQLKTN
jgi:tripartite-type tricarboxylate transporter receptor subunit TctC